MKQSFRFIVFSALVALQAVACADTISDDVAGPVSSEVDIEAVAEPQLGSEEGSAPERAKLLSPLERDEQLATLGGNEPGDDELEIVATEREGVLLADVLANAARLLAEPQVPSRGAF